MKISTIFYKNYNFFIMVVFILLLILKLVLFQWNVYHTLAISSIVRNPLYFWSFWLPKLSIAFFIGTFVFISKSNWWTIFFMFLVDIWMLANMIYLRSNGLCLDGYAFTMADNMTGFWNSCLALLNFEDIVPFLISISFLIYILWINSKSTKERKWSSFVSVFFISVLLNWTSYTIVRQFQCKSLSHGIGEIESIWMSIHNNPFSKVSREYMKALNKDYAYLNYSLLHGAIFNILDYIDIKHSITHPYVLTNLEQEITKSYLGTDAVIQYDNLLLMILIESLESWAVQPNIMPNLCHFIDNHPTAFVKYSQPQIVGGSSGDGQMIINTGLLPIKEGATSFRFPYIKFPSIVNREDSSVTILTHNAKCWNQSTMNTAYGYTELVEGDWNDEVLVDKIINYVNKGYKTIQAITITSHIPFQHYNRSTLKTPDDMPNLMAKYCKSLYITDSCFATLFEKIDSIPALRNATIMITGDHCVFWEEPREEFKQWCDKNDMCWPVDIEACPVIYYSPKIKENVYVDELTYQMDIYPTLLNLTGNNDYIWQGFGLNVIDTKDTHNNRKNNDFLFDLSDKIIRANYFQTVQ